jgi:hypothetical protein
LWNSVHIALGSFGSSCHSDLTARQCLLSFCTPGVPWVCLEVGLFLKFDGQTRGRCSDFKINAGTGERFAKKFWTLPGSLLCFVKISGNLSSVAYQHSGCWYSEEPENVTKVEMSQEKWIYGDMVCLQTWSRASFLKIVLHGWHFEHCTGSTVYLIQSLLLVVRAGYVFIFWTLNTFCLQVSGIFIKWFWGRGERMWVARHCSEDDWVAAPIKRRFRRKIVLELMPNTGQTSNKWVSDNGPTT